MGGLSVAVFPIVGTCALLLLPRSGLVQYMFCDTEFFCDADIACSPEGTTSAMGLGCVKTPAVAERVEYAGAIVDHES